MYEKAYEYTSGVSKKNGECQYIDDNTSGVKVTGHSMVSAKNVDALKEALHESPVSVAIQANKPVFSAYASGIFDDESCGGANLDHAVNLVGWGSEDDVEFWILRNSWSTVWGEEGYMRMKIIPGSGLCGVQKQPQSATADKI